MHQTGRQIAVSGAEVLAASPACDMVVFQVLRERRTTGATLGFPSGTYGVSEFVAAGFDLGIAAYGRNGHAAAH